MVYMIMIVIFDKEECGYLHVMLRWTNMRAKMIVSDDVNMVGNDTTGQWFVAD